ncbi:cinnamyl alcohol dehydrogenase [Delitschia confertaspora ATCC 74209]|uniref:alcohol dehydrogenase (NADP(+)) n=1 Tax=Delitschia confertaspora ATCC 74209 TaxID=1513339 RepID=A0A9P4MWX8_9PLEO|nr:cinnamyl alcohol dehydrogenase [Delitschia confertaspora ATCC 74209]
MSSSSSSPPEFKGWLAQGPSSIKGELTWSPFEPIPFTSNSVDIAISHCGICGSDIHTLSSGWGPTHYPACVGHEIIGQVVRVGDAVTRVKLGDRVGVGAQNSSCNRADCEECSNGYESYCPQMVGTYNSALPTSTHPHEKQGEKHWTKGGYATHTRIPNSNFVFKIPDALESKHAAPMMCAGITLYSPLKRNGAGPGKRVGIVGIGGLGHFGLLFARALGCESVVAISRSSKKKADAEALGADGFIATSEDENWGQTHAKTLDLIISTVSEADMPLSSYLSLLRPHGTFVIVGAPEDKLPGFSAFSLIGKGVKICGSLIGAPAEIEEMLQLAADKKIVPWVEERPMSDANNAVVDMVAGKARYRYVLSNEEGKGEAKL